MATAKEIRALQGDLSTQGAGDLIGVTGRAILGAIYRGALAGTYHTEGGRRGFWTVKPQDLADYDERRRTPMNEKVARNGTRSE